MQLLGISDKKERDDGRLKSIFWPTVENQWDVDHLCRQGFWICTIIAGIQLILSFFSGNAMILVFGIAGAIVFAIGGMGVREASWPAAALVFALYSTNLLYSIATGHLPGVITIIATGILLANVRVAFIASNWKPPAEGEDRPTRFNQTIGDKLADQMPQKLWPVLQIPFFGVASLLLLLSIAGSVLLILQRMGIFGSGGGVQP